MRRRADLADCSQLLLILAETEAQVDFQGETGGKRGCPRRRPVTRSRRGGWERLEHFTCGGRYLNLLNTAAAATAERAAQSARAQRRLRLLPDSRRAVSPRAVWRGDRTDRVLERKPGHFWAQYLNALCLLRQQRPAEARALLSACLAQRSDFVWLYLLRGLHFPGASRYGRPRNLTSTGPRKWCSMKVRVTCCSSTAAFCGSNRSPGRCDRRSEGSDFAQATRIRVRQSGRRSRMQGKREAAALGTGPRGQARPGLAHLYRLQSRLHGTRRNPDLAAQRVLIRQSSARHARPFQVEPCRATAC